MSESNTPEREKIQLDKGTGMQATEHGTSGRTAAPGDRRAMVVDDDPMILKLLTRVLTLMKIDVQAFIDPCDALKMFEKEPVPLVLTDLDMPGMDGIELLIKMKEICPSSKIIIITGYGDEVQEQKAFDHGVAEFMAKPLEMAALKALVTSLLDGSPQGG